MKDLLNIVCGLLLAIGAVALSACSESFTDARDGKSYRVVQIGSQTWMAENLNYAATAVKDDGSAAGSFCPEGDTRKCDEYGRLYTWAAAQSACPDGWRLPARADFESLIDAAGSMDKAGAALKAKSGWFKKGNGSDALGFKALPAGYMAAAEPIDNSEAPDKNSEELSSRAGKFDGIGGYAYFWSATADDSEAAFAHYLFLDFSSAAAEFKSFDKASARSVRCVK